MNAPYPASERRPWPPVPAEVAAPPVTVSWFDLRLEVVTALDGVRAEIAAQHEVLDAAPRSRTDHRVTLVIDPGLVERVRSAGAGRPSTSVESFAGWWYETWPGEGAGRVLASGEGQEWDHVLLTEDFVSWTVVGAAVDGAAVAVGRLLRELIREDLVRRGALMFHAGAAVLPDGRAVMLPGDAGAGKTSSAVRVAEAGGRVVATDRLLLLPPGGARGPHGWWMVGLPSTTRLGAGAVAALGLASQLMGEASVGRSRPDWLAELARSGVLSESSRSAGKLSLANKEVRTLVGGGCLSAAPLDGIVELRAQDVVRPEPTRPANPLGALETHLLVPDPAYRTHWLAARPFREDPSAARRALARLVAEVPVRQLRWSPARHCDDATASLLGAALESACRDDACACGDPAPPSAVAADGFRQSVHQGPAEHAPATPSSWRNE
ncbi:hypothetical protein [Streptomyces sp. NPDC006552]|uniref:hypothetical protein n=1 Tax=Streptomyces sp. NPDC006552 TaxID=3157179 RepID=UPI0033AC2965